MIPQKSYWLDEPLIIGDKSLPKKNGIAVIGSGLAGASCAYWLQKYGWEDVTLIDYQPEKSASFRNCGHILYGTVESMLALNSIHGPQVAKDLWDYSIEVCHEVRDTVMRHNLNIDYEQNGYLVIAIDETEDKEIKESIQLLNKNGFDSTYVDRQTLESYGFRNTSGARFERGSAQAHPVKFRNSLIRETLNNGLEYCTGFKVLSVEEIDQKAKITTDQGEFQFDAAVICANAYNPLLSEFFKERDLIEPFRGQIITSKPLRHDFKIKYPHSFDHGYEYALITPDNRLMIGGWRNHTSGGEKNTYDIEPNSFVENGLIKFAEKHYQINEPIEWDYSWAGIMAASSTGFPFIGPTNSDIIFTCSGFTGHGFSWAHGSAKLLAKIITGEPIPEIAQLFRTMKI